MKDRIDKQIGPIERLIDTMNEMNERIEIRIV